MEGNDGTVNLRVRSIFLLDSSIFIFIHNIHGENNRLLTLIFRRFTLFVKTLLIYKATIS